MARIYSADEVNRVVIKHRQILYFLNNVTSSKKNYETQISDAVSHLMGLEIRNQLKDVPIEEINRDKLGIRIKLLHENGFYTMADLLGVSVYNLASIRGIGDYGARLIRIVFDRILDETSKNTKIRLSLDNKSSEATSLVIAIAKLRRIRPFIAESEKLISLYNDVVNNALKNIEPGMKGSFKWAFTPKWEKENSDEAYRYLLNLLHSDYVDKKNNIEINYEDTEHILSDEAWEDFSENPIAFFNIIEQIAPGALGTDDSIYGLPENLAREIQDECFFPEGLLCELRRYQEWGVKYILHQGNVLLGDEMGLGKTVQAIAVMVSLKNTGASHFLVVCPASVITNWCREIRKHSLLSVTKIHGEYKDAALRSWIKLGGVAVTTYETTGIFSLNNNFKCNLLVVDEAHYIKNPDAQRTKNIKTLSYHAERILFMTGTALENKVDEMISLIQMLQPRVASQIRDIAFLSAAPQFREKIIPVYYRRKREDVLTELPDLIEFQEWCTLNAQEELVYEQAVLSKNYMESRRVSWNAENIYDSCKARRLLELIEDAKNDGRKIIVFSFFLDTIRKICNLLGDKCVNPINGSVSPNHRQEIIDKFEMAPAGTVLPAQIQAGGTGLNIQTASVVIICEPQLKPSIENQAISRAYRMGQTRNVLVYRLLCENSVDERIISLLEEKQKIFDAFADKSLATEDFDVDDKTFGNIIQEEIDRINAKRVILSNKGKT